MSNKMEETLPGACYFQNRLIYCAYEASDCGAYTFVPHHLLPPRKKCYSNHFQYTGVCVDETLCTMDASNCQDPNSYASESPFCNMAYNGFKDSTTGGLTLTGTCTVDSKTTCVFSESDCPEGGVFRKPSENNYSSDCTCENVKVGACKYGSDYYCSVSEDSCVADGVFVPWQDLEGIKDCRLCNSFPKNPKIRTVPHDYRRLPPSKNMKNEELINLGVGIFMGAALVSLLWMVCGCRNRKSAGHDSTFKGTEEPKTVA